MENLLTVEQTADRLQLSILTVRRQLSRGVLRGIKRGRQWRVPESALLESSAPVRTPPAPSDTAPDTPNTRAAAILAEMESGDYRRRNAAIVALYHSDAPTREIVCAAAAQAVADYDGPEDDFSDWRALDGEPFHFPEEKEAP